MFTMHSPAPTVACVIPTHRRPLLVGEAVRSALAQTFAPSEVLVVDDEGSAETRAAVLAIARGSSLPVRYLAHSEGRGPSTSRNLGARETQAEWVAFLDDDDRWLPDYLTTALRHADADVVLTARWDFQAGAERWPGKSPLAEYDEHSFLRMNPGGAPSTLLIRRALFEAIGGFDASLRVSEDRDLILRAMRTGARYASVSERGVEHRVDGPRISADARTLLPSRARFLAKHFRRMSPGDLVYSLRKLVRELRRASWRRSG